jgi:aminocarboxymuconate-semialdehyde decarboxylase
VPAIDVHAHMVVPECAEIVRDTAYFWADPFSAHASDESNAVNAEHFADISGKLTDPAVRLDDMDEMGIGIQAVSIAPPQYYYWTDPSLGEEVAQRQNDAIARVVADHPDRFVGLGTVPLQDIDRATVELRRCVTELGFRGIEICTNVNGLDLDNPRFRPLFAALEELGACVVLHPHGFTDGARLREYYLTNVIGNPLDSTVALARLIFSGVFEEFPDLKLCVVHGGGFLPFYSARMEHAWHHRPECRQKLSSPPSEQLRKVYVDCLVYDAQHLRMLIDKQGLDQVVIGTDYPFDMGYYDPLGQIAGVEGLSDSDRAALTEGNARRLLGLESP